MATMAAVLRNSTKAYHLKLFFSNLNTHAQVRPITCCKAAFRVMCPRPLIRAHITSQLSSSGAVAAQL